MSDNAISPTTQGPTIQDGSQQSLIAQSLAAHDLELNLGDEYIDHDGRVWQIDALRWSQRNSKDQVIVDLSGPYKRTALLHEFLPNANFQRAYLKLPGGLDAAVQTAGQYMADPASIDLGDGEAAESQETALITQAADSAQIAAMQQRFQLMTDRAELLQRVMERKRNQLGRISRKMKNRLAYMGRVISLIESYLGIYEQIVCIQSGEAAPYSEPIHIIQGICYADEEVGDVQLRQLGQVGIDFSSIGAFDEWLMTNDNWQNLTPYPKCVIAIKPSRQLRDYGDAWLNVHAKSQNEAIYLLIRNGSTFYRIFTGLAYGDTLFPTLTEWEQLVMGLDEAENEEKALKFKTEEVRWRQRVALLQGLLDRTETLSPKPEGINLFAEESYEAGQVILHRDYETHSLPDGRLAYRDWRKSLNATVKRGSRIILTPIRPSYTSRGRSTWLDRFGGAFWNNHPPLPAAGIYTIEEVRQSRHGYKEYRFLYQPGDEVWTEDEDGWYTTRPRQRRVSFWLHEYDSFWLHYDHISLDDVAYYIGSRFERRNYRGILPTLYQVWRDRTAEAAHEAEFVTHFAQREGFAEADVWEAVKWWKHKNIWQRPLAEDDKKAWRMIRQRLAAASNNKTTNTPNVHGE